MPQVYINSIRHSTPDRDGARLTVIGESESLVFTGSADECVQYLKAVPIGTSVAVRHSAGIRSCMNKPTLWVDVLNYI